MLEKMGNFFDSRLDCYEAHQRSCITSASGFLRFTAQCLPTASGCRILDLGCGTGPEPDGYFILTDYFSATDEDPLQHRRTTSY